MRLNADAAVEERRTPFVPQNKPRTTRRRECVRSGGEMWWSGEGSPVVNGDLLNLRGVIGGPERLEVFRRLWGCVLTDRLRRMLPW